MLNDNANENLEPLLSTRWRSHIGLKGNSIDCEANAAALGEFEDRDILVDVTCP